MEILIKKLNDKKIIEEKLDCKFIKTNLDGWKFNIFKVINEIHRHISLIGF